MLARLGIRGRHSLKLQRLQNKALRTIGIVSRCTMVRDLLTVFNIPYVYDYATKFCSNKQKSQKFMRKQMFAVYDKAKPDTENIRGLNLAVVSLTTVQVTKLPLYDNIRQVR
jgi:hypothetical protein